MPKNLLLSFFIFFIDLSSANAHYWERLNYRARVISIKELPMRPNADSPVFEMQLEILTAAAKGSGPCKFLKGSKVTAEFGSWQNEDVPFVKPGMELEVECEFQHYKQQGEVKDIISWQIWDSAPSIRYRNASGLMVQRNPNHESRSGYWPPHKCSGSLREKVTLEKVGLTQKLLKKGVDCIAADFDGNGYFDFALFSPWSQETSYSKALVLLFDGNTIKSVSELSDPPTQLCRANYGCACFGISKYDGLEQLGGGESDQSAVFIPSAGEWKRSVCGGCGGKNAEE